MKYLLIAASLLLFAGCSVRNTKSLVLNNAGVDPGNIVYTDYNDRKLFPFQGENDNLIKVDTINSGLFHVGLTLLPGHELQLKDISIPVRFISVGGIKQDILGKWFHWVPNIKSENDQIISQHVFRSPAIIVTREKSGLALIPDLDLLPANSPAPYYLDLQESDTCVTITYGISEYKVVPHQYYTRADTVFTLPRKTEIGFYLITSDDTSPSGILEKVNDFLWDKFASSYTNSMLPQVIRFEDYADRGYSMALEKLWIDGPEKNTGGISLSTFYDKSTQRYRGRMFKDDLWYHSWFNNMRTAYGLSYWGRKTGNQDWSNKALSMVNLIFDAPVKDGFFPIIWIPGTGKWHLSGEGGGDGIYHTPDQSWTAIWLMRFNDELKTIPRCDAFVNRFAEGLLKTQLACGSFPERVRESDMSADPVLSMSASGGLATWFLEEMILRNKLPENRKQTVKDAVARSLRFLKDSVLSNQRFEDFEVYFSCSPKPRTGYFDSVTKTYPQNTLAIQWCAEAFLKAYQIFKDPEYLSDGEFCLNILSMYQQVWNPPFISLYAFGGFGVQNSDAEWNDARQAQFAETFLNYYYTTGKTIYLERAVYACRSAFALMAIPENKEISPLNYMGAEFDDEFLGAMAENFGHEGINRRSYQSGFHWGTGSALTTAAIFQNKLGDIFIDNPSKKAFGINGVVVKRTTWDKDIGIETSGLAGKEILIIKSLTGINEPVTVDNKPCKVE